MITVPAIVRRFRVDLERQDPFWPAQLAALVSILLYVTLPNKLTIGPSWSIPLLETVLFVALVLATPGEEPPRTLMRQRLAVALIGVLALVTLAGLGLLVHVVAEGERGAGRGLLEAAIVLWGTIVLVFALIYWELDRGCPVARAHPHLRRPAAFQFTQMRPRGGRASARVAALVRRLSVRGAHKLDGLQPDRHHAAQPSSQDDDGRPSSRLFDHSSRDRRSGGGKPAVAPV